MLKIQDKFEKYFLNISQEEIFLIDVEKQNSCKIFPGKRKNWDQNFGNFIDLLKKFIILDNLSRNILFFKNLFF